MIGAAVDDVPDGLRRGIDVYATFPLKLLYYVVSVLLFPLTLTTGWTFVEPSNEVVVLIFGKVLTVLKKPGVYLFSTFGRTLIKVTLKRQAIELQRNTVADAVGNPVVVSAVVTYRFSDALNAALNVQNPMEYVAKQAIAVMKQVCSRYPYDSEQPNVPSLKSETVQIGQEMVRVLQLKVEQAGAQVYAFELADLQYSPEIAQQMLMRQSAQALLDARRLVVQGAVEIVSHSVESLLKKNIVLNEAEKAHLVSTLLTVICGEARVQPIYSVQQESGVSDQLRLLTQKMDSLVAAK